MITLPSPCPIVSANHYIYKRVIKKYVRNTIHKTKKTYVGLITSSMTMTYIISFKVSMIMLNSIIKDSDNNALPRNPAIPNWDDIYI